MEVRSISVEDENVNEFLDGVISKLRQPRVGFLSAFEIEKLAQISLESLSIQETLLEIEPPINVCGDTHGQFQVLRCLLDEVGWPPQSRYLFLGKSILVISFSVEGSNLSTIGKMESCLRFDTIVQNFTTSIMIKFLIFEISGSSNARKFSFPVKLHQFCNLTVTSRKF